MKRVDPFQLKANRLTGFIALALVVIVMLWWGIGWLTSGPVVEPRLFVAYFDESAGLREGDAVRIQGRRAGYVTDVSVVQHQGSAQARVEFAIAPGTGSPWLRDMVDSGGVPPDSSIRVRPGSVRGRPQLVINIGDKNENRIEVGGEWKNTRGANSRDTFSQWQEDINRARSQIGELVAFFEDDNWSSLTRQLGEIRNALEGADSNIGAIAEQTSGLADGLDSAEAQMNALLERLEAPGSDDPAKLQEFADNFNKAGKQMDDLHTQLTDTAELVERMHKQSGDAVSVSESRQLQRAGFELREMASRLRASMERAVLDPSRAGNLPPSRFWRPYFHGGEPRRGTSIDEPPVPAPGDGIGLPHGKKQD